MYIYMYIMCVLCVCSDIRVYQFLIEFIAERCSIDVTI